VTSSIERKAALYELRVLERRPQFSPNLGIQSDSRLDRVRLASWRDHGLACLEQLVPRTGSRAQGPGQNGDFLLLTRMDVHRDYGPGSAHN
jgi:hypothetical protein